MHSVRRWLVVFTCAAISNGAAQSAPALGTRELFASNFASSQASGVPAGLRLLQGTLQVVEKDGMRMLKASRVTEFVIALPEALPRDFSIEFDIIPKTCCNPEDLAFEGTATLSQSSSSAHVKWSRSSQQVLGGGPRYQGSMPAELQETVPGQLTRIVAVFEGETLKLYTNGHRLYSLTDRRFARGMVLRVFLGGKDDGDQAVYLARLRVAAGPLVAPVTAATTAASTGTITPSGSTVRAAGTGTIATTAPAPVEAVTTIQPQTGTITPVTSPATPRIGQFRLITNTSVSFPVEALEDLPDVPGYKFWKFVAERRLATDPSGCPALMSDPADPVRCPRWRYNWSPIEDSNLEPGGTYVYRVAAIYAKDCPWGDCPDKVMTSLPASFTPPAQLIGRIDRDALSISSVAPRNVEVKGTSKSTALVTWTANVAGQANPQAANEVAWDWMVDFWMEGTPSTCPSVESGWKVDPTNCVRWATWGDHSLEAWLESGITYKFRVTSIFRVMNCNNAPGCVEWKYYPAEPVSYTNPVYFLPERPAAGTVAPVIPKLFLQVAKQGSAWAEWGCDSSWGQTCRQRDVDFAWAPESKAVGYVITLDEIDLTYGWPAISQAGKKDVPAGPAPGARFALKASSTVRACLGIVGDWTLPPDPRKGECIEFDVNP